MLDNTSWSSMFRGWEGNEYNYFQKYGDTTFGQKRYSLIQIRRKRDRWKGLAIDTFYLREDIASKKVYIKTQATESLLYDYSLNLGDTISPLSAYVLRKIDSVRTIDGKRRKRFIFTSFVPDTIVWIESIGDVFDPFDIFVRQSVPSRLVCVSKNERLAYDIMSGYAIEGMTCSRVNNLFTSVNEYNLNTALQLYPNPVENQLFVKSSEVLTQGKFSVFDVLGRAVLTKDFSLIAPQTEYGLDVQNLVSGFYILKLHSVEGKAAHKFYKK
jgi:hypothetical protein